jgi:hypothetical protein
MAIFAGDAETVRVQVCTSMSSRIATLQLDASQAKRSCFMVGDAPSGSWNCGRLQVGAQAPLCLNAAENQRPNMLNG